MPKALLFMSYCLSLIDPIVFSWRVLLDLGLAASVLRWVISINHQNLDFHPPLLQYCATGLSAPSTTWSTSTISPTLAYDASVMTTPAPTFIPTEALLPLYICGVVGYGEPSSINFITSCVPYRSLGSCDSSCSANPSVLRCNLASPHCGNPRIGPQGKLLHLCMYGRQSFWLLYHSPCLRRPNHRESSSQILGDDSQVTYGTVYPKSVLPTGNLRPTMTSFIGYSDSEIASSPTRSSSTTSGDTAAAATPTESDHHIHLHNMTSPQEMYDKAQTRKEIIVGTVIGGFMSLLVAGLVTWFLWAWFNRRKNLWDDEKREGREFGLRVRTMDAGTLTGGRGKSTGDTGKEGLPTPTLEPTSTPKDIQGLDPT